MAILAYDDSLCRWEVSMGLRTEINKRLAERLLEWNARYLNHKSPLSEENIAEIFSENFIVRANGRVHRANHGNYKEFLDEFRRNIESIEYIVHEMVSEDRSVVVAMKAKVVRVGGKEDIFEAMLLLAFDAQEKVSLWHEVYVSTPASV
ncbi:MAG: nuclear transport factor 2 family protein [Rhodoferax sp.]